MRAHHTCAQASDPFSGLGAFLVPGYGVITVVLLNPAEAERIRAQRAAFGAYNSMIRACDVGNLDLARYWVKQMDSHLDALNAMRYPVPSGG